MQRTGPERAVEANYSRSHREIDALSSDLRESDARYRTLFDLVPVAVYAIDTTGVIVDFNRRAAELWGREPAIGDTDERFCGSYKLFRPDGSYMPHPECPMALVVTGALAEVHDGEVIIERPDGSRITVIVNIRPHKNEHGEVIGAINCFYDITGRKRMEEALRQSDRNKTEFLAMLAHELRNPLAPVLSSIDILRRAHGMDERGSESGNKRGAPPSTAGAAFAQDAEPALRILTRQTEHIVRLVDDLLDAARISRGKINIVTARVDLLTVLRDTVDATRPLAASLRHELTATLPPGPIFVQADRARLAQIVGNLLNNACKYTPRGGRISLTAESVEPAVIAIRVRDTGVGIAAGQRERIFDMFAQVDTSADRTASGLGIGLTLVKTLTELHGGSVEVNSAGPDQGSEFIVRLPMLGASASS